MRWSVDGRSLFDAPTPGETVALHWDWVCDVVSTEQARRIVKLETATLADIGLAG